MPNTPSTQDQLSSQNGHYRSSHGLSDELLDFTNSNKTPSSTLSKSSESLGDDWSTLTQELIDTLPRVWTRSLLYLLIGFAGIVLPWAMLSKVDETGSARGRLEPKGQTFRLDAPVAGKVTEIQAKEGQTVKAGQSLLELESELVRNDLQQAQTKLESQLNRLSQLELIKNQLEITTRTQRLHNQAQVSEQLAQTDQIQQRLDSSHKAYALAKDRLASDQKEVQRYRRLWQEGVVAEVKVVEPERTMNESQRLLEQAHSDIQQAKSELKEKQSTYERIVRTGELTLLQSKRQLEELQTQRMDMQAEIAQPKT